MEARSIVERPDELRAHLRGMWVAVAGGWERHAGYVDDRGAGVTQAMLAATRPQPGERVLELACGPPAARGWWLRTSSRPEERSSSPTSCRR
jgi:hypothetical protein